MSFRAFWKAEDVHFANSTFIYMYASILIYTGWSKILDTWQKVLDFKTTQFYSTEDF